MKRAINLVFTLTCIIFVAAAAWIGYTWIQSWQWNSVGDVKLAEANAGEVKMEREKQGRISLEVSNLLQDRDLVLRDAEKLKSKIKQLQALQRTEKVRQKVFLTLDECNKEAGKLALNLNDCMDLTFNLQAYIEYMESINGTNQKIIDKQDESIASGRKINTVLESEVWRQEKKIVAARNKTRIYKSATIILSAVVGVLLLSK